MRHHSISPKQLLKESIGLLVLDKGFVLKIQFLSFLLLLYVFHLINNSNILPLGHEQGLQMVCSAVVSLLNTSAILFRLYHLKRGQTQSLRLCYRQAFARFPAVLGFLILGILCATCLFSLTLSVIFLLQQVLPQFLHSFIFLSLFISFIIAIAMSLPYMSFIFLVGNNQSLFKAIANNYQIILYRINTALLFQIATLYVIPSLLLALLSSIAGEIATLLYSIWILICHCICIIVHDQVTLPSRQNHQHI